VAALNKPDINSEYKIDWIVKDGDTIKASVDVASVGEVAGIIVISNPDYQVLKEDFEKLKTFEPIQYKL